MQTAISTLGSVEVLPVPGGRRQWLSELKARIVAETLELGATVRDGALRPPGDRYIPMPANLHETHGTYQGSLTAQSIWLRWRSWPPVRYRRVAKYCWPDMELGGFALAALLMGWSCHRIGLIDASRHRLAGPPEGAVITIAAMGKG